jgi:glucose/arabinose dehydrogenase
MVWTRRTIASAAIGLLLLAGAANAALRLDRLALGIASLVGYVEDPVVPGTFLAVSQDGVIHVVADGVVRDTPFLDLRGEISRGGERGLLGLAFPPDAGDSGRLFVNFTNRSGHTVIARFTRRRDDPSQVAVDSRFDLDWGDGRRVIEQPFANHNGGHLAFGPDGYLYIGLGDGGSGNDPQNRAQTPTTLLGKMLRIDVSVADADPRGYAVPPDNPFVRRGDVRPEIWAFGYRNPWRYSFDDVGEGATLALVVGDVGQNAREEIDYEPGGAGGRNYGWRHREGTIATPGVPPAAVEFGPLVEPIHDYGRGAGQSVTGGYVYRGTRLPAAYRGRYFFGDFGSGRVWSLGLALDPATGAATVEDVVEHTAELGGPVEGLASFARDREGELALVAYDGTIHRLVGEDEAPACEARDERRRDRRCR